MEYWSNGLPPQHQYPNAPSDGGIWLIAYGIWRERKPYAISHTL